MQWNIVDGRLVGFIKDDENDNIVPDGVCLRDGKIVSIRFPDGKYAIGKSLCEGIATLETVVIPTGVTQIEEYAFRECSNLVNITIPNSVANIGDKAFRDCKSLESIENMMFEGCQNLSKVVLPNSIISIASSAFYGRDKLESLELPDRTQDIVEMQYTFGHMDSLKEIILPQKIRALRTFTEKYSFKYEPDFVTVIPHGMFQGSKKLKTISVPGSVEKIDVCCFADCESLENVILHEGTQLIRDYAFAECPKLREVVLPNSLETIERYAFKGCSALNLLYIGPNVSLIEEGVFEGCTSLTVFVQAGSYAEKYAVEHEIAMEIKRI